MMKIVLDETEVLSTKLKNYLDHYMSPILLVAFVLFFVAIVLRFIPDDDCYKAARVILCIDLIFWFVKSLKAYWSVKLLGPMLVLIENMTVQLFYYVIILLLFVFAFGISTQALMFPNQPVGKHLLKSIFFPAFFIIGKEYYTRENIMNGLITFCFISQFLFLLIIEGRKKHKLYDFVFFCF